MTKSKGSAALRLLIAEDNEVDVFLLRKSFDEIGLEYEATVATNGEEVLALINASPDSSGFDGIILDLNLKTHSGLDILRRIRELPALAATRVVILTSSSSPEDDRRAIALGANALFKKPIDLYESMQLGKRISELIQQRTGNAGAVA